MAPILLRPRLRGRPPARNERGQAISVMMIGVTAALLMVAGLVIDGGQKATAISRAESVAAGAARAAADAGAAGTLDPAGSRRLAVARARDAARTYLDGASAEQGSAITGAVRVDGDRVLVSTRVQVTTIFLSVIGIDRLVGTGTATAEVVPAR